MRTGIVRSDEATRIGEEDSLDMFESNWFIPLKWSVEVLKGAQKEGLIKTPPGEVIFAKRNSQLEHKRCAQGRTLPVQPCKNEHKILQNATTRHQIAFTEFFLQSFNELRDLSKKV